MKVPVNSVKTASPLAIGLLTASSAIFAGCQSPQPPPRIAIPDQTQGNPAVTHEHDPVKPLRTDQARAGNDIPPPPFDDQPLVNQKPPEQREFVEAYERIGKPRIAVLVNPQLKNGAEDELSARAIDYADMETTLADWFSCGGRVMLISPTAARQSLGEQGIQHLQSGDPNAARQVADRLNADVLIEVQVQPTRQSGDHAARIVAEAVNTRGGQSIGRAVADVPPPLDKAQINKGTRNVARKMMDDMAGTWNAFPAGAMPAPAATVTPLPPPTSPTPPAAPPIPPRSTATPIPPASSTAAAPVTPANPSDTAPPPPSTAPTPAAPTVPPSDSIPVLPGATPKGSAPSAAAQRPN